VANATGGATAGSGCGQRAGSAVAGGGRGKAKTEADEEDGDTAHRARAAWRAPGAGRRKSDQTGRATTARTWAGARMLSFTGSLKVYVAVEPCDMRKSFEGLAALVTTVLKQDLRSGALFVFSNRPRNRVT
jgi:IS66 Orf2 like protein